MVRSLRSFRARARGSWARECIRKLQEAATDQDTRRLLQTLITMVIQMKEYDSRHLMKARDYTEQRRNDSGQLAFEIVDQTPQHQWRENQSLQRTLDELRNGLQAMKESAPGTDEVTQNMRLYLPHGPWYQMLCVSHKLWDTPADRWPQNSTKWTEFCSDQKSKGVHMTMTMTHSEEVRPTSARGLALEA